MDAGEPSHPWRIPFGVGDDLDPFGLQHRHQVVQSLDAEVQAPLLLGREVVGVRLERRKHCRTGLLIPHPVLAPAHAEMLRVPLGQRLGILRAEHEAAYAGHTHGRPFLIRTAKLMHGSTAGNAWAVLLDACSLSPAERRAEGILERADY